MLFLPRLSLVGKVPPCAGGGWQVVGNSRAAQADPNAVVIEKN